MTERRNPWPWLGWLVAFLVLELAALSKRVRVHWLTLSETVPRWFPTKARFLLLAQFLLVLIWHLYGMVCMSLGEPGHWSWSAQAIAASGALPALSIAYAEWERRSKVGIVGDVKLLLKLKAARDRLREAAKMGKLKTVAFALVGAVATGAIAQVTGACPDLLSAAPAIAMAGFGGMVTYLMRKPLAKAGTKALLTGAGSVAIAAIIQQVNQVCGAGFADKVPSLLTAGAWVGLGLWLKAPHEAPSLGQIKTPPALQK